MDTSHGVGIVIGRFQVDEIHVGHRQLLQWVRQRHPQMAVLLGCRPTPANRTQPMDFVVRQAMVLEELPDAVVLPVLDTGLTKEADLAWSRQVDGIVSTCFPGREAVLYGGRDSFIPHYHGRFAVRQLDMGADGVSSTGIRQRIKTAPRATPDFRAGIIYAIENQPPRIYPTVDIAVLKGEQVLLGRKAGEAKWRFPGGFVDMADATYEAAARRELGEETGLTLEGPLTYVGSFAVDDWRTRGLDDAKTMTTLYRAEYSHGAPRGGDDLPEVAWHDAASDRLEVNPTHAPLLQAIREIVLGRHQARQFIAAQTG